MKKKKKKARKSQLSSSERKKRESLREDKPTTHVEEEGQLLKLVLAEADFGRLARLEAVAQLLVNLLDLLERIVLQISGWGGHF